MTSDYQTAFINFYPPSATDEYFLLCIVFWGRRWADFSSIPRMGKSGNLIDFVIAYQARNWYMFLNAGDIIHRCHHWAGADCQRCMSLLRHQYNMHSGCSHEILIQLIYRDLLCTRRDSRALPYIYRLRLVLEVQIECEHWGKHKCKKGCSWKSRRR